MAFDLYAEGFKTSIEQHEISMFHHLNPDKHPQLKQMWNDFYDDPTYSFDQSNEIVHELIDLKTLENLSNSEKFTIEKLLMFFSRAYISKTMVHSSSD